MSSGADDVDLDPISALRDERARLAERIADIDLEVQEHVRSAFEAGVHYTAEASCPWAASADERTSSHGTGTQLGFGC